MFSVLLFERLASFRSDSAAEVWRSHTAADAAQINPLQPFYLVYAHDSGAVRFGFA